MDRSALNNLTPESRLEVEKTLLEMEKWRKNKDRIKKPKGSATSMVVVQKQPPITSKKEDLASCLALVIAVSYKTSELAQWFDENSEEDGEVEEAASPIDQKESARIEREIREEDRRNAKLGLLAQQTVTLTYGRVITKLNRPLKGDKEISENRKSNCPHHWSCLDSAAMRDWPAFSCINCLLFK
ncbi:MAG: hypothetical protein WCK11_03560 [Candidatus Falkowbacteria bacterium]